MVIIREERKGDIKAIRSVNDRAFGQPGEGWIVDKLRDSCDEVLSLVAIDGGLVVGHICFSPVVIESEEKNLSGMGLAPMAVLPEYQNKGIGTMLVRAGIEKVKHAGYPFIVVLGRPDYYPRFGFERASIHGIKGQWEVPDEAFMVMIFDRSRMPDVSGVCKYRDEFNEAM